MTIDEDCEEITFWEISNNKQYTLNGRVDEPETLKEYLSSCIINQ